MSTKPSPKTAKTTRNGKTITGRGYNLYCAVSDRVLVLLWSLSLHFLSSSFYNCIELRPRPTPPRPAPPTNHNWLGGCEM